MNGVLPTVSGTASVCATINGPVTFSSHPELPQATGTIAFPIPQDQNQYGLNFEPVWQICARTPTDHLDWEDFFDTQFPNEAAFKLCNRPVARACGVVVIPRAAFLTETAVSYDDSDEPTTTPAVSPAPSTLANTEGPAPSAEVAPTRLQSGQSPSLVTAASPLSTPIEVLTSAMPPEVAESDETVKVETTVPIVTTADLLVTGVATGRQQTQVQVPSNAQSEGPQTQPNQVSNQQQNQAPTEQQTQVASREEPEGPQSQVNQVSNQQESQAPAQQLTQIPSQEEPEVSQTQANQAFAEQKAEIPSQEEPKGPQTQANQVSNQQVPAQRQTQAPSDEQTEGFETLQDQALGQEQPRVIGTSVAVGSSTASAVENGQNPLDNTPATGNPTNAGQSQAQPSPPTAVTLPIISIAIPTVIADTQTAISIVASSTQTTAAQPVIPSPGRQFDVQGDDQQASSLPTERAADAEEIAEAPSAVGYRLTSVPRLAAVIGSGSRTSNLLITPASGPIPTTELLAAGETTYPVNSASAYVIAGQTLTLGGSITLSSSPSATVNSVNDGALAVAVAGSDASPTTPPLTVAGQIYSANAAGEYVVESQTLTPVNEANSVIGSGALPPASSLTVADQTFTANPDGVYVIEDQTFMPINRVTPAFPPTGAGPSPMASPLTVVGQTYSANTDGVYVLGSQALTPINAIPRTGASTLPTAPPLAVADQTYTANIAGAYVIEGQTLMPVALQPAGTDALPRAPLVTVAGQTYTANTAGVYVIEGQNLTPIDEITSGILPTEIRALPTAPILTIADQSYSTNAAGVYVIGGQTLGPSKTGNLEPDAAATVLVLTTDAVGNFVAVVSEVLSAGTRTAEKATGVATKAASGSGNSTISGSAAGQENGGPRDMTASSMPGEPVPSQGAVGSIRSSRWIWKGGLVQVWTVVILWVLGVAVGF